MDGLLGVRVQLQRAAAVRGGLLPAPTVDVQLRQHEPRPHVIPRQLGGLLGVGNRQLAIAAGAGKVRLLQQRFRRLAVRLGRRRAAVCWRGQQSVDRSRRSKRRVTEAVGDPDGGRRHAPSNAGVGGGEVRPAPHTDGLARKGFGVARGTAHSRTPHSGIWALCSAAHYSLSRRCSTMAVWPAAR